MTCNDVHKQIVNCHCRSRKRIHNSTVNKKAKIKIFFVIDCIMPTKTSSAAKGHFLDWSLSKLKQF